MYLVLTIDWLDCVLEETHCETYKEATALANKASHYKHVKCVQIFEELLTVYNIY